MDSKAQSRIRRDAISLFFLPVAPRRYRSERAAWCVWARSAVMRLDPTEYARELRAELRRLGIDASVPRPHHAMPPEHREATLWWRAGALAAGETLPVYIEGGGYMWVRRARGASGFEVMTLADDMVPGVALEDVEMVAFELLHPEHGKQSCVGCDGFRCSACGHTGANFDSGRAA